MIEVRYSKILVRRHGGPEALEWFREDLSGLFGLLADRSITPLIAARLPLGEARRAHELLARGEVEGKLVLACGEP